MAAEKELFNQPLKTIVGVSDRVAIGVPSQEGCDNMLIPVLLNNFIKKDNNVALTAGGNRIDFSGSFTSADYVIIIREYNGIAYDVTAQDIDGFNIEVLANTAIDYLTILV